MISIDAAAVLDAHRRIAPHVRETPVELGFLPRPVWLKLEHLQRTGSFKFRGACNKVALLTEEEARAGVVTASNGNHGLGVAAAAQARGIAAEVFVSSQVAAEKASRIEAHGAAICRAGDNPLTAELAARRAALDSGRVFISPYNDLEVAAGQGTIAVELHRQAPDLDAVYVAVGGGGLIAGIGAYFKEVSPRTQIVGCWPVNSPVMLRCMEAGRVVDVGEQYTLSESTAGGLESDSVTLPVCRRVIDRAVVVSEQEIAAAIRLLLHSEHWLVEGAAGVALAACLQDSQQGAGRNVTVVLCGRNLSHRAMEQLDL
jgi:threonine dehydratase